MKKVKILLSAVAVFALVGGALAFKANKPRSVFVHDANDARVSACTKQIFAATLTANAVPVLTTRATLFPTNSGCPIVTIYRGE